MKNGKFEQKDLDKLNEIYYDDEFDDRWGPLTCREFRKEVEELIEGNEGDQEGVDFWSIILENLNNSGSIVLYDVKDKDGFECINEIMRTLSYDNGKPLTTDDYNYFDHYDRDQDFWSFFEDELIDHFEFDKDGNINFVLVMTYEELVNSLTDQYDDSSWDHDFGD